LSIYYATLEIGQDFLYPSRHIYAAISGHWAGLLMYFVCNNVT